PGARRGGERPGFEPGVPGDDAQQFPAGIAAGTRHRHPDTHVFSRRDRCPGCPDLLRDYAWKLLSMQHTWYGRDVRGASGCQSPLGRGMMSAREGGPMRGHSRAVAVSVLAALAASAVTGCGGAPGKQSTTAASGGPGASASSAPAVRCGRARTAAGVPVDVEIVGQASCHTAMTVERAYSRALASGKVPGNGGGAPATLPGRVRPAAR